MSVYPVLIDGQWREPAMASEFTAENPATGERLPGRYPVSTWADCDAALSAAADAAGALRGIAPETIAAFLVGFADRLEVRAAELVERAHLESALPESPRLSKVELPRTTDRLRQAAGAAAEGSWAAPTIDTKLNIRSHLAPIGPVVVFGPSNFPFAFSGVAGGDFAAAVAAGNPVIAKGHPLQPGTTRLLAEEAFAAVCDAGLPPATVQLLYHIGAESGLKLVSDARVGASAFTGSRAAGLALKAAADHNGTPIYLEMSSINPVVILPAALEERGDTIAGEFAISALLGGGQFCTNPGLVITLPGPATEKFIDAVRETFDRSAPPTMLSRGIAESLSRSVARLERSGAAVLTNPSVVPLSGCRHPNTLLRTSGDQFLAVPEKLQGEAFGSAAVVVVASNPDQLDAILGALEGSLTGSIYSDTQGGDDELYARIQPRLRCRVGRLLNDKMPTGVAVSPAMNHGGPFPATGHPGFTAVGIPNSLRRFGALHCYDGVRDYRLPAALRDKNPNGSMWRSIDRQWTQADVHRPTTT